MLRIQICATAPRNRSSECFRKNACEMANSTLRAADDTFGPFVEPIARTSFDFTLLFEQSIFSIGPSALLLLVAPFRILCLSRSPRRVARSPLAIGKLVSGNNFGQGGQADYGITATSGYLDHFACSKFCTMDDTSSPTDSGVHCCSNFVVRGHCGTGLFIIYGTRVFDPTKSDYKRISALYPTFGLCSSEDFMATRQLCRCGCGLFNHKRRQSCGSDC